MIARYKEIIFGLGLGLGMWLIDAAMHVEIRVRAASWADTFITELFYPGAAQLFFRMLFFVMATFFGLVLWHSNLQQRQAQALERTVRTLHRELTAPILLILGYSKILETDTRLIHDDSTRSLIVGLYESARKLQQLIEEAPAPEKSMAGAHPEAIDRREPISESRPMEITISS